MHINLSISSFKKFIRMLPGGFTLALVVGIIVEIALSCYAPLWRFCDSYYGGNVNPAVRYQARLYTSRLYKDKVFIVGSSVGLMNIDENILNKKFESRNLRFFNLSVQYSDMSDIVLRLPLVLKTRPRAVILPLSISTFNHTFGPFRFFYLLFTKPLLEISTNPKLSSFTISNYVLSRIQSATRGLYMRLRYRRPLSSELFITFLKVKLFKKDYTYKNNFFPFKTFPKPRSYFIKEVKNKENRNKFSRNYTTSFYENMFIYYINELLRYGCYPIVVEVPMHPLAKYFYTESDYRHFREFLQNLQGSLGFTYFGLQKLPYFSEKDYSTFLYFSDNGRKKFMNYLKDKLAELELP